MTKRLTLDIDQETYYLDGELLEDWNDPYYVCEKLNKVFDDYENKIKELKQKIINMEQAEDDVINFFKIHENRFDIHMKDEIEKEFGDVFDD